MHIAAAGVPAAPLLRERCLTPGPDGGPPDPQVWVPAIQAGDVTAFEALFRTLYPPLVRYLRRMAGADVAEELAQEVFVGVWRRRAALDPARSIRSYLFRAAHNAALNHGRRVRLEARALGHIAVTRLSTAPTERSAAMELATALHGALATLPPRCREVFSLSRDGQLTHAQIAIRLGLSVKTVENHMGRALRHLRHVLRPFLD